MACDQLDVGLTTVVKCVNPLAVTRQPGRLDRDHEPWDDDHLVIDTAATLPEVVVDAIVRQRFR